MPVSRPATSSMTAAVKVMLRRPQRRRPPGSSGRRPAPGARRRSRAGRRARPVTRVPPGVAVGVRLPPGRLGWRGGVRIAPGGGSNDSATPAGRLNSRRRPGAGGGGGGVGGATGGASARTRTRRRAGARTPTRARTSGRCGRTPDRLLRHRTLPGTADPPLPPVKSPSETQSPHPAAAHPAAGRRARRCRPEAARRAPRAGSDRGMTPGRAARKESSRRGGGAPGCGWVSDRGARRWPR